MNCVLKNVDTRTVLPTTNIHLYDQLHPVSNVPGNRPCNGSGDYRCPNGRCIRQANVCDSQCDCKSDCADEVHCESFYSKEYGRWFVCQSAVSLQFRKQKNMQKPVLLNLLLAHLLLTSQTRSLTKPLLSWIVNC